LSNSFASPEAEWIGVGLILVAVAWLIGLVWGRAGRGRLQAEILHLGGQLRRAEATAEEHGRTMAKIRREHGTVANLALCLPHVVRDMNRNDLDTTEVPRLILQLANSIFQPGQVLLYWMSSKPGADWKQRELKLVEHRGFDEVPEALKIIPMGKGKIGWVAQHVLDMLPGDWDKLSRTERVDVADNDGALRAEIIGPLIHHSKERQQVLGVLAIGKLGTKPQDPKLMFQMVTNIGSLALVSGANMNKLRSMANHDGLTTLLNKRSFLSDFAPKALLSCERDAKPYSIFIFDLDHFKNYNDTNGHPAGDELLRGMARLIKANLRPGDLACRYGGEEFVVSMPDTDPSAALEQAEKMRRAVEATPFPDSDKQPLGFVSVSGGVASFPKHGSSVAELVQHADEVLYESKKGGRNRVALYRGVEIGDTRDFAVDSTLIDTAADPAVGGEKPYR
jgi:diguanylate cyclase (GGDEF)-like protein